ncbi:hypothetical protein ASF20_04885 [Methylobacterium sp. Leaf88]|nr:hypothetical protein ASF20_04885 [Methylobacterium sp. Leaf88]
MFRWRIYLVTTAVLALPISGFWLHAWHIGAGLNWLEPDVDLLVIAALSVGASAFLAFSVTRSIARS